MERPSRETERLTRGSRDGLQGDLPIRHLPRYPAPTIDQRSPNADRGLPSTLPLLVRGTFRIPNSVVVLTTALFSPGSPAASADPALCAAPGNYGPEGAIAGVGNTYYPGAASVPVGSNSIAVGAHQRSGTLVASGDLLLAIEMQDATIHSTSPSPCGDGVAGGAACRWKSLYNASRHSCVIASGPVSSRSVLIRGAAEGDGLVTACANDDPPGVLHTSCRGVSSTASKLGIGVEALPSMTGLLLGLVVALPLQVVPQQILSLGESAT